MREEARWAARYQFLEEVWRGRDRLVHDPSLERAVATLGGGRVQSSQGQEDVVAALLDRLLPRSHDEDVWLATSHVTRIAEFSRARPGVHFVAMDEAAAVAEEGWEVALVNLEGVRSADDLDTLPPNIAALVEVIEEHAEDDRRVVVVMLPGPAAGGPQEDVAMQILGTILPQARLFGVMWPTVASVITVAGREDDEGEDDFTVDVDNSLAAEAFTLTVDTWIAVSGAEFRPATLTMIEVENSDAVDDDADTQREARQADVGHGLRAELIEARRQADLHAIDKQRLSELLDDAQTRLADAAGGNSVSVTGEANGAGLAGLQARLEGALAREQALRWELARVQAMLDDVASRPVEELEADNARLRVELASRSLASSVDESSRGRDADAERSSAGGDGDTEAERAHDHPMALEYGGSSTADEGPPPRAQDPGPNGDAELEDLGRDALAPDSAATAVDAEEAEQEAASGGSGEARDDARDVDAQSEPEGRTSTLSDVDPLDDHNDYTRAPVHGDDEQTRWNDAPHEQEEEGGFDRLRRGLITTIDRLLRRLDN